MTIWSDMLDNIYVSEVAVDAVLITADSGSVTATLKAIDKTVGIEVDDSSEATLLTIRPAAYMRMAELTANSITRTDLDGGTIAINGKTWLIKAHALRPNPDGELKGEVCVFLEGEAA